MNDCFFPYVKAKRFVIELLKENLPVDLKDFAEIVLYLHLREDTLAMPNMTFDQRENVKLLLKENTDIDEVAEMLTLEDTNSKLGMFRVMVRTHLNSQGKNHVSMGQEYGDKTLSPRIFEFTDLIDLDSRIIDNQLKVLNDWKMHVNNNLSIKDKSRCHDERAKRTFEKLCSYCEKGKSLFDISKPRIFAKELDTDQGWTLMVLGVFTGLHYLQQQKWAISSQAKSAKINADEILKDIKNCEKNIVGYATALAGSFQADLGGSSFVKPDTHVIDSMNTLCPELKGNKKKIITAVINSAIKYKTIPRALDKLMYIGCSGNLPLLGINLEKSVSTLMKKKFIDMLERHSSCDEKI